MGSKLNIYRPTCWYVWGEGIDVKMTRLSGDSSAVLVALLMTDDVRHSHLPTMGSVGSCCVTWGVGGVKKFLK